MKPLDTIIKAIKTGDFVTANEAFNNIMQSKVSALIANERRDVGKKLNEAKEENKCELCGGKQNVKRVDDTWICGECDIEEDANCNNCDKPWSEHSDSDKSECREETKKRIADYK